MIALLLAAASLAPACTGSTTPQIEACLSTEQAVAEATLSRYLAAADAGLRTAATATPGDGARAAAELDRAQQAWRAYRDAECGAVGTKWRSGTIGPSFALACRIRLTRLRTVAIWSDWLTYPDSTPPLLPRPSLTGLHDRDP